MRGPLPSYQPEFSKAELGKAEAVSRRRQAPHAQVCRARLALELARTPAGSCRAIGDRLGLHAETGSEVAQALGDRGILSRGQTAIRSAEDFFPRASSRTSKRLRVSFPSREERR